MNEIGNVTKAMQGDKGPEGYKVTDEECGCCTRIDDGADELCWIATPNKAELAALLLGLSKEDLAAALKLHKEYKSFKENGIAGIGVTDKAEEEVTSRWTAEEQDEYMEWEAKQW